MKYIIQREDGHGNVTNLKEIETNDLTTALENLRASAKKYPAGFVRLMQWSDRHQKWELIQYA